MCFRHRCPKGRLYLTFGHHCPRVGHPGGAGYPRYYELCFFGGYDRAGCHCGEFAQRAPPQELQNAAAQQTMFMEQKSISDKFLYAPGRTLDGVPVEIGLNMGKPAPEVLETSTATDYVGLLRTEFLFIWNQTTCLRRKSSLQLIKGASGIWGAPGDSADAGYRWG